MQKIVLVLLSVMAVTWLSACSPEVGSEAWCKQMKQKDAGDWTANEAKDYTKHCVFK